MKNKDFLPFFKALFVHPFFWIGVVVLLYFLPMFLFPQFAYIDDGYTLLASQKIIESPVSEWSKYLFESHIGRMRPMYYLYFVGLYLVVGPSALGFWVARAIIIFLTIAGIYRLTTPQKQKGISWFHLIISSSFLLLPQVIENTYRLGPAETQQAVFLVWFLVLLKKVWRKKPTIREIVLANLLFAGALLTKETAILLFPLFGMYFLSQLIFFPKLRKSKEAWGLAVSLMIQTTLFFIFLPEQQGYASSFKLTPSRLWLQILVSRLQMAEYYLLLLVAGIGTALRFFIAVQKKKVTSVLPLLTWPAMYLAGITISLIFVFSWEHQLGRYYYLTLIFMWLYLLEEGGFLQKTVITLKKLPQKTQFTIAALTLSALLGSYLFIFQQRGLAWHKRGEQAYRSAYTWFRGYQTSGSLTKYLVEDLPEEVQIYTTATDYEPLINMGYFSSQFGKREVMIYSQNVLAEKKHPESHIYVDDVVAAFNQAASPKVFLTSVTAYEAIDQEPNVRVLRPKGILEEENQRFWRIKEVYQ